MKREKKILLLIYLVILAILVIGSLWPKKEAKEIVEETHIIEIASLEETSHEIVVEEPQPEPIQEETPEPVVEQEPVFVSENFNAVRMTSYIMDGQDAGTCIAGRWCLGGALSMAEDTSVRYEEYNVYAVHCSIVGQWRGSIIRVHYTDGIVEDGIVLDCGGFGGHTNYMDKAMGTRYNGNQDNYVLSKNIAYTEVIRKGW